MKAVCCPCEGSATLLESAVHRGFDELNTQPFTLWGLAIADPTQVRLVQRRDLPTPARLHAGIVSGGQQAWGAALLAAHPFVVLPSVLSKLSGSVVFRPDRAADKYALRGQGRLAIDARFNSPRA